ncbi:DUF4258 domain-containing protein [Candidatus Planktophila sulfonica]|uniref:DUF4258 domain-containing protein n=1 Tax=Candidatus Planktophila sulfonica TaxID=1884904 RepID=UPI001237103F
MDFIYSRHARRQMLERRVTEEEINYVLHRYSLTYPADKGGTSLFAELPDGRKLVVWLANSRPLNKPFFIKSVARRDRHV